ncbi:hypothetical protein EEB19_22755 [Gordonia sp. OPL2]|nr:hypothetical protein EEB19_22755 [Gordonia sp. OPL2]
MAGGRILDLCSLVSGPWAIDTLGDHGADVIKIEVPGKGDLVRQMSRRADCGVHTTERHRHTNVRSANAGTPFEDWESLLS